MRTLRTRRALKALDATYRARAVPPGTARYWSWLFAATESRAPVLGIYALWAEWQALLDPATEAAVAYLKLAWWQEEMQRLTSGSPVHPISVYLAALPRAAAVDFQPLRSAVSAAAAEVGGVPLERAADLEAQSRALWGAPLALASLLAADGVDEASLHRCTGALAAGDYISRALRNYRRQARAGRIPFAIDELLAAGIDSEDLTTEPAPARLEIYFEVLRARAARYFDAAAQALPQTHRHPHRHLLVLAALGSSRLHGGAPTRRTLQDMLLAWRTARRAHV